MGVPLWSGGVALQGSAYAQPDVAGACSTSLLGRPRLSLWTQLASRRWTARSMSWVAASGWETNETCEPRNLTSGASVWGVDADAGVDQLSSRILTVSM